MCRSDAQPDRIRNIDAPAAHHNRRQAAPVSADDPFGPVLEALHAAAFDEAAWPAASGLIDALCGSKGNVLTAGCGRERRLADVMVARLCYRGRHHAEWERAYYETWYPIDERVPPLRRLYVARDPVTGLAPGYGQAVWRRYCGRGGALRSG